MSADVTYKTPFYLQLREVIRTKIEDGDYPPGCAIPSENQLAETYGVNRLTVRNAVDALVTEGALLRVQGRGMYVVGEKSEYDQEKFNGFRQVVYERSGESVVKILIKARRQAGTKYSSIFGIAPEDELFYIKRLNSVGGDPISIEETFVPCGLLPRLDSVDLNVFELREVYGFYNISLMRTRETVDLVSLESRDANLLNLSSDDSVLLLTSTSYDAQERVIEYNLSYMRSDTCCFTIHKG